MPCGGLHVEAGRCRHGRWRCGRGCGRCRHGRLTFAAVADPAWAGSSTGAAIHCAIVEVRTLSVANSVIRSDAGGETLSVLAARAWICTRCLAISAVVVVREIVGAENLPLRIDTGDLVNTRTSAVLADLACRAGFATLSAVANVA